MASSIQRRYIKDLAVKKLKEFKEFKEMIISAGIVSADAKTVSNADSIDAILDATTDLQASKIIDVLVAKSTPVRSRVYSNRRAKETVDLLDKIIAETGEWSFK